MPDGGPLIAARGISKRFGGVEVLSDIDLDLYAGEIHALLGENGAGKSTFAKILAGVHRPTRGRLAMDGRRVEVPSPAPRAAPRDHAHPSGADLLPGPLGGREHRHGAATGPLS